jgi:RNA polymerase sigma-70 factor (ECF subfamily)
MVGDGGGKAPQWGTHIIDAENMAQVLAALVPPLLRIGGVVEPHQVNGQPGAIVRDRDGNVLNALGLDILDGQIQPIRTVIDPDKLGHVGPVGDVWTVYREAIQGSRARCEPGQEG